MTSNSAAPLPLNVRTIFLDAGNTLIAMDLDWVSRELATAGVATNSRELERAECAARPQTSRFLSSQPEQSGLVAYVFYLERILEALPDTAGLPIAQRAAIAASVGRRLKRPRGDHKLWSRVLPGVPAALASLRSAGFRLVVVSNSDGSVERALDEAGLRSHVDVVLDSAVVGYEKPDPRFFEHALRSADADAASTLHVGDMYYQDVLGARAAGIGCVLLDPFEVWPDADCPRRRDLAAVARELAENAPG